MATAPANTGAPLRAPEPDVQSPTCYRTIPLDTLAVLGRINRACREHRITVSRFGRRAVGDPRLHSDLMNGRSLRPGTRRKIASFIASLGEA